MSFKYSVTLEVHTALKTRVFNLYLPEFKFCGAFNGVNVARNTVQDYRMSKERVVHDDNYEGFSK